MAEEKAHVFFSVHFSQYFYFIRNYKNAWNRFTRTHRHNICILLFVLIPDWFALWQIFSFEFISFRIHHTGGCGRERKIAIQQIETEWPRFGIFYCLAEQSSFFFSLVVVILLLIFTLNTVRERQKNEFRRR